MQTHAIQEGWLRFDLSQYNIYLTGEVIAAIEFIPGAKKTGKIVYEIKPGGRIKSYVRTNSLGVWQVPPHQYRMYVTALTSGEVQEEEEKEIPPAFTLYSQNVNDSFCLFVRLPAGYKKDITRHYPTIYLLDANLYFPYLNDSIGKLPATCQPILIGIGYRDFIKMDSFRDRDYTYPAAALTDSLNLSGGGAQFYDFIAKELIPLIDRQYRSDTGKRCLIGHSLGGYFTLYALYRDISAGTGLFRHYVAASPSVEYHNQYLKWQFEQMDKNSVIPQKTLLVTMGSVEGMEMEGGILYSDGIGSFIRAMSDLKSKDIQLNREIFQGAGHMETAIPSMYMGLQKVIAAD